MSSDKRALFQALDRLVRVVEDSRANGTTEMQDAVDQARRVLMEEVYAAHPIGEPGIKVS